MVMGGGAEDARENGEELQGWGHPRLSPAEL